MFSIILDVTPDTAIITSSLM